MANPYIIRVASQKGGVGKTTIATNLAVTLSTLNYNVLIVDCDAANPSVGIHLGMVEANEGYKEVVEKKAKPSSVIVVHAPSGLKVLPGTIGGYSFTPEPARFWEFVSELSKMKYDFIILDTSPGFSIREPTKYYSEALLITTPEMSACTSVMRLAKLYTNDGLKHSLVINRIRNKKYEYSVDEIEDMYENRAIAAIPEDEAVPISVAQHIPTVMGFPKSEFSVGVKELGRRYSSRSDKVPLGPSKAMSQERGGIFSSLRKAFGGKR
jgi:flagellar biosynthesis protein FlhG